MSGPQQSDSAPDLKEGGRNLDSDRPNASPAREDGDSGVFNEDRLRFDITTMWGEHGAHADLFDHLVKFARGAKAVHDLHERVTEGYYHLDVCSECTNSEDGSYVMWPCSTIRALHDA